MNGENTSDILFERRGAAGFVILNRPKALNALSQEMILAFARQLRIWQDDDAITRVVVTANGGRAFCAGGDIRAMYELNADGKRDQAVAFFGHEYRLNAAVKHFRKPYVSLIDGIAMGGGVGISVHGSHRVAGDNFSLAMPEVGIGFFPDVGATWFLPRLPGKIGTYCALTGSRFGADDAAAIGVATHRVPSRRMAELADGLTGTVSVDALLGAFAEKPKETPLFARKGAIDRLFKGGEVEDILAALDAEAASSQADAGWARESAKTMRGKSPTSLKIALRQMRIGADEDFDTCMRTEYRIVSRVIFGHDFYEGVRAVIIDKDNKPQWRPADLAAVAPAEIDRYFARLTQELPLP